MTELDLLHLMDAKGPHGGPKRPPMRPVLLWRAPLRLMHWTAAVSILLLVITGLYIGHPFLDGLVSRSPAATPFWMGWMRFIHFVAAALLVMSGIVRFYWLFAGGPFERWAVLWPGRGKDLRNMVRVAKHYLFIGHDEPKFIGHNPLQQFSYTGVYLVAIVMIVTGFSLYGSANPAGWAFHWFGWVAPLLGGLTHVRALHHVLTYVFVIFAVMHIYLAFRADRLEKNDTLRSIVRGRKLVEVDTSVYEDGDRLDA